MSIHPFNLKYYLQKITSFLHIVLLTTLLVVSALLYSSPVNGGPYLDSAHGNTSYGVNRSRTADFGYTRGNCAHCHEQHASIDGQALPSPAPYHFSLFYDDALSIDDLFCFTCHSDNLTWQPVTNHPYAKTFGGSPYIWYEDIYTQFADADSKPAQCGSRHNLLEIWNALKTSVGQSWGFNTDPDPCVACHPPHAVQRNKPPTTSGDLNTCIRLPSKYKSTVPEDLLWGDDDGERMDNYAASKSGVYQPPFFGDTTSGRFEPTGTVVNYSGDRTPDYVTFCMECHEYQLNDPERGVSVQAINWNAEIHGGIQANTCDSSASGAEGITKAPYTDPNANYVLSCLDCHEPHGTKKRQHLIRRYINGRYIPEDTGPCETNTDGGVCVACHNFHTPWPACLTCHGNWHGGKFTSAPCEGELSF